MTRSVAFVLPRVLPSLNVMLNQHWAKRLREKTTLAHEVMAAMSGSRHFPRPPFAKARITIVRHGPNALDIDGLYGSCKPLLDVLCVSSKVHPTGLGIIEDDAPSKCELIVTQQHASRGEAFTVVRVEELG